MDDPVLVTVLVLIWAFCFDYPKPRRPKRNSASPWIVSESLVMEAHVPHGLAAAPTFQNALLLDPRRGEPKTRGPLGPPEQFWRN